MEADIAHQATAPVYQTLSDEIDAELGYGVWGSIKAYLDHRFHMMSEYDDSVRRGDGKRKLIPVRVEPTEGINVVATEKLESGPKIVKVMADCPECGNVSRQVRRRCGFCGKTGKVEKWVPENEVVEV